MAQAVIGVGGARLSSAAGMTVEVNANGSLRRFDCASVSLLLFPGSEVEGGLTNLYLRRRGDPHRWTPLLGPRSCTAFYADPARSRLVGLGVWLGIEYRLSLLLAGNAPAWFWHVYVRNATASAQQLDLTYVQDLALAPYSAVRMNEYYVSQYVDHTPLRHPVRGTVVASRQNQAVDGRYPWSLVGSLRAGVSFATDALQFFGLAGRRGAGPPGLTGELSGRRLQHEHSLVVIRDEPLQLAAGEDVAGGFFGWYAADHPDASSSADLSNVDQVLQLAEAAPPAPDASDAPTQPGAPSGPVSSAVTLFSSAPRLEALDLDAAALRELFPGPWRHEEFDQHGQRLSFFHGADRHVVLRSNELCVQRPHGHLLRTGRHLTPAEAAMCSTAWMGGTFHALLAQGHVSINRFLSTVRGYLGLFRAHGQRVFVELAGSWQLLDLPSAFEMWPEGCRWIYRHGGGVIEVNSTARSEPQALMLSVRVSAGEPARLLICHHVALNGDDGAARGAVSWQRDGDAIRVKPAAGSELARRFPQGAFRIVALDGTGIERIGGDELLFADAVSRSEPYLCIVTSPAVQAGLAIHGELIGTETQSPLLQPSAVELIPTLQLSAPAHSPLAQRVAQLAEIAPWFTHDAMVHYLSPHGLEQYSGGGWGTRDVCQGPVEMLLALGRTQALRDVLCRVMSAQNADGDWPQWFMFFERERNIRAGDSHGDVVLWPLVVAAQYLLASGDAAVLEERVPFFDARGPGAGERASIWEHVQRALSVIDRRLIPGTALAAYGHGDWNDSLQPVDPRLRERLCSAWTVTLHVQALQGLAHALRSVGRAQDAPALDARAQAARGDFQRLLVADGVLAGYALFEEGGEVRRLLHPADDTSGVHYSALAMIHAIIEDLFTPQQTREHLRLIAAHLSGPDGLRLFDRPLPYHGGPQRMFQRAESAAFFGREIGLMYTHAHLRYAQALAHVGEAELFFQALCQANPIRIDSIVPGATRRQANCYYSSSDAAFEDRYQASSDYERVSQGAIAFDGGWRVYSSGAGIALGLILRRLLGVDAQAQAVLIDPVMPAALDGLRAHISLCGRPTEARYRVGPAGCGVQALRLNNAPLAFTRDANPHRPGAAVIARATLQDGLIDVPGALNTLEVQIG